MCTFKGAESQHTQCLARGKLSVLASRLSVVTRLFCPFLLFLLSFLPPRFPSIHISPPHPSCPGSGAPCKPSEHSGGKFSP